jgi:hypothetical protein
MAVSVIAQESQKTTAQPQHPLPTVTSGEMPLYPDLPRKAAIEGKVVLRVTTDGERVTDIKVEDGQPMLAKAAEANLRTWHFARHSPTTFLTSFTFHLLFQGCELLNSNGQIVLNGPAEVDITATAWRPPRSAPAPRFSRCSLPARPSYADDWSAGARCGCSGRTGSARQFRLRAGCGAGGRAG